MGGDGMYSQGFITEDPASAEGWYASIAAPNTLEAAEAKDWVAKYKTKYNRDPQTYAIMAYDAVLVIADTVERIVKDGKPIDRSTVRDYAQKTSLPTMQGTITFDENGDIKDKVISVFQVVKGDYKYVGSAPQD